LHKTSWVNFVPDAASAFTTLTSIVEALHPRKREMKASYFQRHSREFFVPDESGNIHEPNDAAEFAAAALADWARTNGLPEGEERMLMTLLDTLGAIVTATDAKLQGLPIERKTRANLHQFFGSEGINDVSIGRNPVENLGSSNIRSGKTNHPHTGTGSGSGTHERQIAGPEYRQGQDMTQYASEWIATEDFEYHQPSAGGMLGQAPSMHNSNGVYYVQPMPMTVNPYGAGWPLFHQAPEPTQMTYRTQQRPMIPHRRPSQGHPALSFHPESYGEFQGAAANQRHFSLMHQGGLPQPGQPHHPQHRQQQSMMPNQEPIPFTKTLWPTRHFH
jgi:hypothetical protein